MDRRNSAIGGMKQVQTHELYEINLRGKYNRCLKVLGHSYICGKIPRMARKPWMTELKEKKIFVSDLGDDSERSADWV